MLEKSYLISSKTLASDTAQPTPQPSTYKAIHTQEVVTYISAFVTRIKIGSSDQSPFESWSRDQGNIQTAKIKDQKCTTLIQPPTRKKLSDQKL